MMISKVKRNVMATASLVVGGLASWLLINALVEERGGLDVFVGHQDKRYYGIDAASAIACAGISHCLQSCYNRWQTMPVIFSPELEEGWKVMRGSIKPPASYSKLLLTSPESLCIVPTATAPPHDYQTLSPYLI